MTSSLLLGMRTAAERLSRGVVLRRRMPAQYGGDPIFVSPGALLKLWWPDLRAADPALFGWVSRFVAPGDVVWDIGANVGLFAFAAAARAGRGGRVVAVEADIWLAALLRRSACEKAMDRAPVEVLPLAISARVELARFNIAARSRAANFLEGASGSTQAGGVRETQTVMSVTLDWLLEQAPAPRVVKIDVEGAEAQVLGGAARLLADVRPTIICEVRADNARAVTELLRAHGYALFDLADSALRPVALATFNTLALPQ